jgi:hypothetical protein
LAEARAALPLVERIVKDVVAQYRLVRGLEKERQLASHLGKPDELRLIDERGHAAAARLGGLIEELGQVGCELKDLEKGLVDFPGMHEGRPIELCWMLGEPTIDWWHEPTAGFAGRQPVAGALV